MPSCTIGGIKSFTIGAPSQIAEFYSKIEYEFNREVCVDAAILWDAIANQYPEVDFVHVPEFDAEKKDITVGVLTASSNEMAARKSALRDPRGS